MNELIRTLVSLDPVWMYIGIFLVAYLENLCPPVPSDVAVVLGGALAAAEKGHFILALISGVAGSTLGFMTMYAIGSWFGRRIIDTGKIRFLTPVNIQRMDNWFNKYGYWLVVANRFLAGTRSVVSFFAGISKLRPKRTLLFAFVSSFVWYGILVYAGYSLGENWKSIVSHLTTYTEVISVATIAFVIILVSWYAYRRYRLRRTHA